VRANFPPSSRLHRAPRTVVGYDGCSRETAERILAGERFAPSRRAYDWLGEGIYFWEYGPFRAREWAEYRFGSNAAVLEVTIRLGRCLNLLDIEHITQLGEAHERAVLRSKLSEAAIPENRDDGRYYRDQFMIEFYCQLQAEEGRALFQTVRGCYPEGKPAFPGSKSLSRAHVQVAVRDDSCLTRTRLVGWR
jgi:hypothetical protein